MPEIPDDRPRSIQTGAPCTDDEMGELTELEFYVERQPWRLGFEVWVRGKHLHTSYEDWRTATGFAHKEFQPSANRSERATFVMSDKSAQQLMDELWAAGVRPGDKLVPPASTADALKAHLADMRDIAFGFLKGEDLCQQ